jgi:hypothetical protein
MPTTVTGFSGALAEIKARPMPWRTRAVNKIYEIGFHDGYAAVAVGSYPSRPGMTVLEQVDYFEGFCAGAVDAQNDDEQAREYLEPLEADERDSWPMVAPARE